VKDLFVENMVAALADRLFPTVTMYNRLEGRPRADNFDRALRAEVRDALWFLARQWQMGEFRGDDAGSPVLAKLVAATTRLTKFRPAEHDAEALDDSVPLEAQAERQTVPLTADGQPLSLDLRILMGRRWLKLTQSIGYAADFKERYRIRRPDATRVEDAAVCAHAEEWQAFAAASGRCVDGAALYNHLKSGPLARAYDDMPGVAAIHYDDLDRAATEFVAWFERLLYQPETPERDAWDPARLEYRFGCSAPTGGAQEQVLVASEYYQGNLDWYALDHDVARTELGTVTPAPPDPRGEIKQTLVPAQLDFAGKPNSRWWAFEDGKTNFGDVKPDTTDLAKLLLVEFGLVYANDWFIIPMTLDVGTMTRVRALAVTNVFGDRLWIEPASRGIDDNWQRWCLFANSVAGSRDLTADSSLLLLPTIPKIQEGPPREEVQLVRDEMANMVWGVENTVWLPSGQARSGGEAANETLAYVTRLLASNPPAEPAGDERAPIRYTVQNTIPEHWIPFIPVHVKDSNREVQLQRAAMPRFLPGTNPVKVRPRTPLLREGLDRVPQLPYFVHEEEVPRAGVQISRSFQRARWQDGRAVVWFGARKQTGRGEGSSGLAFDQIV
jgi:hypothetical protein